MDNKKIPTSIGAIILVIIAITAGMFVWTYEKGQDWGVVMTQTQSLNNTDVVKPTEKNQEPSLLPLVVAKPATEWTKTCKNIPGNYEVKYPDEWTVKIGDAIYGIHVLEDCDLTERLKDYKNNTIYFSPLDSVQAGALLSGIVISFAPNATRHSFVDVTQEMNVGGEKMTWVHKDGTRLLYHGTTEYNIVINDDVNEDLVREFFSTFKFLP